MDKKGKFAAYFKGCLLQAIGYRLQSVRLMFGLCST
jgi:hypothetical protein